MNPNLGPAPPERMPDLPAFRMKRWSIVSDLTAAGEAVMTFVGCAAGNEQEVSLLLTLNPRTGDATHCTVVYPGVAFPGTKQSESIGVQWIPGIVADIARTKVLEVFGPKAAIP